MRTRLLAAIAASTLILAAGSAAAQAWMSINERQARLDERIDRGPEHARPELPLEAIGAGLGGALDHDRHRVEVGPERQRRSFGQARHRPVIAAAGVRLFQLHQIADGERQRLVGF